MCVCVCVCVCKREREREREPFFCKGKLCIKWKRWWQIYSKRVWIRRDKNRGLKGKMKNDINVEDSGEMRRWENERRRKVGKVMGRWKDKGGKKLEKCKYEIKKYIL